MPRIHVCPLARLAETAQATGARSMVTLINPGTPVALPKGIEQDRYLRLSVADIDAPVEDFVAPEESHVRALLRFAHAWDRRAPLLIHCHAGVSRSTAAALIAVCALNPTREESEAAQALREASPTATPNKLLIRIADTLMSRRGKLVAAVNAIGRGEDCYEGAPFAMELA